MSTRTRFEKEAKGNSEMAYCVTVQAKNRKEKEAQELIIMAIMASGVARGRVRTTAKAKEHKKAAILQLMG